MLVDGDNISPALLKQMLDEVRDEGRPIIRRVYGDWTQQSMAPWKAVLHEFAFQPIQQFRYIAKGNSTDCAMIIDAMDILHEGSVNAFCLVSSDSDYTRLATRLQESDMFVMGIGKRDSAVALQRACNRFVSTDLLEAISAPPAKPAKAAKGAPPAPAPSPGIIDEPQAARPLIARAFDLASGPDGVALLAALGNKLMEIDPSFDTRAFGKKKLLDLVDALKEDFVIERLPSGHVRLKRRLAEPPTKA